MDKTDLYTAVLIDLTVRPSIPKTIYTHAYSHLQAVKYFSTRYPYPKYAFDQVKNELTGVVMTREDYFATHHSGTD